MPLKSDELFSAWARKQWKSIYLFAGSEEFLIDQAIQQATSHWLPEDATGFGKERVDFDADSVDAVLEALRTPPFMGGRKVLRVDHAGALSSTDQTTVAEALSSVGPDVGVILVWGKEWRQRDDLKKPLIEAVLRLGDVVVFWPLFPDQARRWVLSRATYYRKGLDDEAAGWLLSQVGENLQALDQELAKCSLYVGERPNMTLTDLQASFGYERASSPFDWVAAIRRHDGAEATRILERLREEGEEPIRLLALLSRTFRDWLSARSTCENPALLALRFHVRRGQENQFARELLQWGEGELVEAIGACVEAERSIKSGKEEPGMALTLLNLRVGGLKVADALR